MHHCCVVYHHITLFFCSESRLGLTRSRSPDTTTMAQTPQQRRANERFAKSEAAKRGKASTVSKPKQQSKSPISTGWVVVLAFVVCGGLLLELLRIVPEIWNTVASVLSRITG